MGSWGEILGGQNMTVQDEVTIRHRGVDLGRLSFKLAKIAQSD
jgi:hypothetical protein